MMTSSWSEPWMHRLGELGLQITLWCTLGLALLVVVRKGQLLLRKRLALIVCAGFVALSGLALVQPLWRVGAWVSRLRPEAAPAVLREEQVTITVEDAGLSSSGLTGWFKNLLGARSGNPSPATASPSEASPFDWVSLLPWVCLACSAYFLARLGAGVWLARRYFRDSVPLEDDRLTTVLGELQGSMRLARPARVRESAVLAGPAMLGWRRPLVLLPAAWRTWSDDELRCVLAHELAHVGAADFLTHLFVQFVRALHGYHPLVHLFARQAHHQLELLADARAAGHVGRTCYLKSLCQLALRPAPGKVPPPALAFLSPLPLSRRMKMLAETRSSGKPLSRPLSWAGAALLVAAVVAVAGLRGPAAADDGKPMPEANGQAVAANAPETALPFEIDDFDLRFVPADADGVMTFRPALAGTLPWLNQQGDLLDIASQESLGYPLSFIKAAMIDQVVSGLRFRAKAKDEPGMLLHDFSLVRLRPGHSWDTILANAMPQTAGQRHTGKSYYKVPLPITNEPGLHVGVLDARTLVLGSEGAVKQALDGSFRSRQLVAEDWKPFRRGWFVVEFDLRKVRPQVLGTKDSLQAEILQPYEPLWQHGDHLVAGLMYGANFDLKAVVSKAGGPLNADADFRKAATSAVHDLLKAAGVKEEFVTRLKAAAGNGTVGTLSSLTPSQLLFQTSPVISYSEFFPGVVRTSTPPPVTFQSDTIICDVTKEFVKQHKNLFHFDPENSSCGASRLTGEDAKGLKGLLKSQPGVTVLANPSLVTLDNRKAVFSVGPNLLQMTQLHQLNAADRRFKSTLNYESPEGSGGTTVEFSLDEEACALLCSVAHKSGDKIRLVFATVRCLNK